MKAAGDGPQTTPDMSARLPAWARAMARQYPAYAFARCDVFRGRAVAAVRMQPGTGPRVVITSREKEMRAALGRPALHARADAAE